MVEFGFSDQDAIVRVCFVGVAIPLSSRKCCSLEPSLQIFAG